MEDNKPCVCLWLICRRFVIYLNALLRRLFIGIYLTKFSWRNAINRTCLRDVIEVLLLDFGVCFERSLQESSACRILVGWLVEHMFFLCSMEVFSIGWAYILLCSMEGFSPLVQHMFSYAVCRFSPLVQHMPCYAYAGSLIWLTKYLVLQVVYCALSVQLLLQLQLHYLLAVV